MVSTKHHFELRVAILHVCSFLDDYMIARNKAKVAEETSDLNTADENETPRRKRVQKILSSSDSSSENDCLLSRPPKLSNTRKKELASQSASQSAVGK